MTEHQTGISGMRIMSIEELKVRTYIDCAKLAIKNKELISAGLFIEFATYAIISLELKQRGLITE